ncbi:uncharacterized protein [Macrobrachium rosenbergii]|uniref:uncharacterized protein n=1 Tax=Macrobrachium rosenbergii TaxID=79674 RepID=UPI0034D77C97
MIGKERLISAHLYYIALGLAVLVSLVQTDRYFTAVPSTAIQGTTIIQLQVTSRSQCAALADAKGCEGFTWNLTSGTQTSCAVYGVITGLVNTTGVTAYLTKTGRKLTEGFVINDNKILLPAPVGVTAMTYDAVVSWCISRGTKIFIPRNTNDWNFMVQMAIQRSYGHIWIPMTDIAVEGTYVWQDGTSISNATYVTWGTGTVGSGNSETLDCVSAHLSLNSLYVHTDPCTYAYNGFICA